MAKWVDSNTLTNSSNLGESGGNLTLTTGSLISSVASGGNAFTFNTNSTYTSGNLFHITNNGGTSRMFMDYKGTLGVYSAPAVSSLGPGIALGQVLPSGTWTQGKYGFQLTYSMGGGEVNGKCVGGVNNGLACDEAGDCSGGTCKGDPNANYHGSIYTGSLNGRLNVMSGSSSIVSGGTTLERVEDMRAQSAILTMGDEAHDKVSALYVYVDDSSNFSGVITANTIAGVRIGQAAYNYGVGSTPVAAVRMEDQSSSAANTNAKSWAAANDASLTNGTYLGWTADPDGTGTLTALDTDIDARSLGITYDAADGRGEVDMRFDATGDGTTDTVPIVGWAQNTIDYPLHRNTAWCRPQATSVTALTCNGLAAPTDVSPAATMDLTFTRMYLNYTTGGVSGNAAGVAGNGGAFTATRPAFRPKQTSVIRTSSTITSSRIWIGVAESTLIALAPTTGSAATGIDYVGVAYDAAVNSGKFMCCAGDGTNHGCTDMGLTLAVSTDYKISVDYSVSGTLTCRVNSTTTTRTTNLPTGAINIGNQLSITTTTAAARTFFIGHYELEQN